MRLDSNIFSFSLSLSFSFLQNYQAPALLNGLDRATLTPTTIGRENVFPGISVNWENDRGESRWRESNARENACQGGKSFARTREVSRPSRLLRVGNQRWRTFYFGFSDFSPVSPLPPIQYSRFLHIQKQISVFLSLTSSLSLADCMSFAPRPVTSNSFLSITRARYCSATTLKIATRRHTSSRWETYCHYPK